MYEQYLDGKSIFGRASTIILLVVFFAVRLFSYLLADHLLIQGIIVFCLILMLGILYFKNPHLAWYVVIGEIFLGGSGHFLELNGLSIRSLFIITFLFLWLAEQLGKKYLLNSIKINKTLIALLGIFLLFLFLAAGIGIANQQSLKLIIQNSIPFFFLILIFPSYHLFRNTKSQERLIRLVITFILGTAIFSGLIFFLYSSGSLVLQDNFYHWYRDVAAGKITDMGNGFMRIVEPEHLLLVPIILFISSLVMRDEKHNKMWYLFLFLAMVPLVLNFSRTYFLAFFVGLLILKYKHRWYRWLAFSAINISLIILIFVSASFFASGGTTFGTELLGIRFSSVAKPQTELSAATRMMILPSIIDLIKVHPLVGSGLGQKVTYFNSFTFDQITTDQYDWGYLQLLTQLGLFGLISFLSIVFFALIKLLKKIRIYTDFHDPDVGFLAGLVAFMFMTIFMPALFHVFGIFFLMLVLAISVKPTDSLKVTVTMLYRVFNGLKKTNLKTN